MSNYRSDDVRRWAGLFKALSNPNRLRLFLRLVSCCRPGTRWQADDAGRACVGALGKDLRIAPSTVSHHMKELNQAGLIRMERQGQHVECWVDAETMSMLAAFFDRSGRRRRKLAAAPGGQG